MNDEPHKELITHEAIRARAQELWEQAGRPSGRDEEFWIEAENQLLREWAKDL